jgi:hypothetical protein
MALQTSKNLGKLKSPLVSGRLMDARFQSPLSIPLQREFFKMPGAISLSERNGRAKSMEVYQFGNGQRF